jgi:hypothetical protein
VPSASVSSDLAQSCAAPFFARASEKKSRNHARARMAGQIRATGAAWRGPLAVPVILREEEL